MKWCLYKLLCALIAFLNFRINNQPDVRNICRTISGLTKEQIDLCYRANDVTSAALDGLELGKMVVINLKTEIFNFIY